MDMSEERFSAIFDGMTEGVVFQNADGCIELCNQSAASMLGLSFDEMRGRTSIDPRWRAIHEDGSPFPGETHPAMVTLHSGEPQTGVIMGVHKPDGSLTWISINSRAVVQGGKRTAVVTTFTDVTAATATREALEQTRADLQSLVDSTTDLIWSVDLDYRLQMFNEALRTYFRQNTGVAASAGMTPVELLPPERALLWPLLYQRALSKGAFVTEHELLGGGIVELRLSPIVRDGRTEGVAAFGKVITERKRAEELAKRHAVVREQSRDALLTVRASDGRILVANPAAEELYGFNNEELLGLTVGELRADCASGSTAEYMARAAAGGVLFETVHRRKDGTPVPVEVSSRAAAIGGEPMLFWSIRDITGRKRAEEALRESEEKFRALFLSGPDVRFLASWEDSRILDISDAVEAEFGYSRGEVTAANSLRLGSFFDAEDWATAQAEVKANGRLLDFEMKAVRKDAKLFICSVSVTTVTLHGEPYLLGSIHVTAAKLAEARLRESEERFAAFMERLPAAAFLKTEDGRMVYANQYLKALTGISDIVGKTTRDLFSGETARQMEEDDRQALAQGTLNVRETAEDHEGGLHTFAAVKFPVYLSDGSPLLGGIAIDVTEREESQRALESSEAKWRSYVEHAPVGVLVADSSGRHIEVNHAAELMLGYEPGELLGTAASAITADEDACVGQLHFARVKERGYADDDLRLRRKNGSTVWCSVRAVKLGDDRFLAIFQDLTQRKQAESALREAARFNRQVLDNARDGIIVYDLDLHIITWSRHMEELTGVPAKDVVGRLSEDVFPFTKDVGLIERLKRVLVTGQPEAADFEFPTQLSGRSGWASDVTGPLRNEAGEIVGLIGTVREITERKQAEQELARANLRLRVAAASGGLGIWDWDVQTQRLTWDDRQYEMYGVARHEFASCYDAWLNRVHPDDLKGVVAAAASALRNGNKFDQEFRIVRPNGEIRYLKGEGLAERDAEGKAVRMVGLNQDITGSKRAQQERERLLEQLAQAQRMESIGCLAGGVAHDFNNLLTVINGYSELALKEMCEDDPLRKTLREIHQAGERAAALTGQLLAYSRKQVLQPQVLELNVVLEGMRAMLERLVGENLDVRFSLSPESLTVRADLLQLEQVVMNLAVNARDAMPRGGRLIFATDLEERSDVPAAPNAGLDTSRYAVLVVSDTGVGMDEETRQRIFEPFYTTKGRGEGTGLGLSMVEGIVLQSGGFITVDSKPGQGTTFRIYLPHLTGETPQALKPEASPVPTGYETILLVEDQEEVRDYVAALLMEYGYEVIPAAGAAEALRVFETRPERIHLLLTDVVMPQISGKELASQLVKIRPDIRVLYMSGYTDDVIVRHGVLDEGAQFIQKPFSPEALARKVRMVLGVQVPAARIVVVDDEPGVRSFLRVALEQAGHKVIEAANGKDAIRQVKACHGDLVITDLVMPDREGIETIRELRREMPGLGIIAISGAFGGRFLVLAEKLGADAVLAKPVRQNQILAKVAEVLISRR